MQFHSRSKMNNFPKLSRAVLRPWLSRPTLKETFKPLSTSCNRLQDEKGSPFPKLSKNLKDEAQVVIVGGGVVGTSIAYHLAKRGVKDVVLLEKTELTAGSTWHAAGLTTSYHPTVNVKRLHFYSLSLYAQLEAETGQEVGFHRPGSLRLLSSPGRMDEAKYIMQKQGWQAAPMWVMTPQEVERVCPIVNMDGILGGLFSPGDGHIDPYSLTQALAIGARMHGAEIFMPAPVLGMTQTADGRWNVETPHGNIKARQVINAGGFWGRELGRMVGLELPLVPVHHQYVVTSTIPEVQKMDFEIPVIRDLDGSYYLRRERNGLLFGPYEAIEKMKIQEDWWDQVPPGFGKELYQSDLDRIMDNVEMAMSRFPVLQSAEIASVVAGPITYTPDILPMVGPHPDAPNYWVAVGFGYGIIHAGGVGKYLADWVTDGEPPFECIELDPSRYGRWTTKDFVIEKCRESYGLNNLQIHPKEERFGCRPVRTSPIYQHLKAANAEFGFHSGWEVPHWFAKDGEEHGYCPSYYRTNWFDPVGRECHHVLNKVGLADLSAFAKIEIKGKDAAQCLDRLVANKLPPVGGVNVSHMLTPRGKVYAEVTVSTLAPDHFFVITGGGSEYHDLRWITEHAKSYGDVQINNLTDSMACLSIAGPLSRDLLTCLTDDDVSNDGFKFMACKNMSVAGVPVLALRVSYTGELGWEFYVKNEHTVALYEALMAQGQKFDIDHFGSYAVNALRLEKGFRLWGAEMNKDTGPYEAGLGFFIKLNKGADFIGRDALLAKQNHFPEKKLVCLLVDTDNIDAEGNETIWSGNKVVGYTTSGSYGYQVQHSIAYAYLPTYLSYVGSTVDVELLGKRYTATVVQEPLVEMEATRVRKQTKKKKLATL